MRVHDKYEIVYIDHYDSFSHNVIDWIEKGSSKIKVKRVDYDSDSMISELESMPLPVVISPGPGHPADKRNTCHITQKLIGKVPILGICLGHQILGYLFGGRIRQSRNPLHGFSKLIRFSHNYRSHFKGFSPKEFEAGVYNSLVVEEKNLDPLWSVCFKCSNGEVYGIERLADQEEWALGVQFHPESFLSSDCDFIRDLWLERVLLWYTNHLSI